MCVYSTVGVNNQIQPYDSFCSIFSKTHEWQYCRSSKPKFVSKAKLEENIIRDVAYTG